jgi:hypothetical protein
MASARKTTRQMQPAGSLPWPEPESSRNILWLRCQFLLAALTLKPEIEAELLEDPQIIFGDDGDSAPPLLPELTWDPFVVRREMMENRYREYLDRVQDAYRSAGCRPTRKLRQPAHVWWLAGYQVCGWSKNAIAEAASQNRAGVVRAINDLAREIGLRLRATAKNDPAWTVKKICAALNPEKIRATSYLPL